MANFVPSQPREKWQRKRTSMKMKVCIRIFFFLANFLNQGNIMEKGGFLDLCVMWFKLLLFNVVSGGHFYLTESAPQNQLFWYPSFHFC